MVTPPLAISRGTRADFDELLALLDAEFIFGKGHRHSLAMRFPDLFDHTRQSNFLLARSAGGIVAALAVRPFGWITAQRIWRAAMIGMVCTHPAWRGRGVASAVMQEAQAQMARENLDFGVLWATRQSFYARLGWTGADCGTLGMTQCAAPDSRKQVGPPDAKAIDFIESVRGRHAPERATRTREGYSALLPHAEQLEFLRGDSAYAIVGRNGAIGYLYEMLGDPGEIPALWSKLAGRYGKTWLNMRRGSAEQTLLSDKMEIEWRPQQLAMWLPLSAGARNAPFAQWYVPFLDRI